ncbi:MAG: GGDEF domain-containing protein [Desulfuromonadales bacterium]|nr:GGDEF domain-containing protein [Desulfuromonadales bacterium]
MKSTIEDLFAACKDDCSLISGLTELSSQHGNLVYQEALLHLVGKSFQVDTAARYWQEAIDHRELVLIRERQKNGLRPALLDYLHQVVRELHDPRIVEANHLKKIQMASIQDGLTGLFNQSYFKTHLKKMISQRPQTEETMVGCVLFDLDHFKQYNDRCGHVAGDLALQQVAQTILAGVREGDVAARYGGEEFGIVLSHVTAEQTFIITDRIRHNIEALDIAGQQHLDRKNLTISAGFAMHESLTETANELLRRADSELYKAKLFRNAISPQLLNKQRTPRQGSRRKRYAVVEYSLTGKAPFLPAVSHNISPYGIAIECEHHFALETPLFLRFRKPFWPGNREVWTTVCHINTPPDGPARLGLKFDHESALSFENIAILVKE